jgi:hypothetical protein
MSADRLEEATSSRSAHEVQGEAPGRYGEQLGEFFGDVGERARSEERLQYTDEFRQHDQARDDDEDLHGALVHIER